MDGLYCFNTELVIYSYAETYEYEQIWQATDRTYQIEDLVQGIYQYIEVLPECSESDEGGKAWIGIYAPTCAVDSTGALASAYGDCSTICQDPATLFLPFNFRPCFSLGMAAMLLQNGTYYLNETNPKSEASIRDLQLGNLTAWNGTSIVQNTVDCLVASCNGNNLTTCSSALLDLTDSTVDINNLDDVTSALQHYCDNVPAQYNSDIAGPGVMLSYELQIVGAIVFWVVVKAFTTWSRIAAWPFLLFATKTSISQADPNLMVAAPKPPGRIKSAWIRAKKMQKSLRRLRLHAATIITLVEFQETQSFLIGAIQIAALVTFRSSRSSDNPVSSFQEAITDNQMVIMLGANGIYPIILVQTVLRRYDRRGWYLLGLLWINTVLAIVIIQRQNELTSTFDTAFNMIKDQGTISECGGNPNPMTYCNVEGSVVIMTSFDNILVYCTVSLLTIDRLVPLLRQSHFWKRCAAKTGIVWYYEQHKWFRVVVKTFRSIVWLGWSVIDVFLLYFITYYLYSLVSANGTFYNNAASDSQAWTFGQLIAVLVWLPVATKFVYYNLLYVCFYLALLFPLLLYLDQTFEKATTRF